MTTIKGRLTLFKKMIPLFSVVSTNWMYQMYNLGLGLLCIKHIWILILVNRKTHHESLTHILWTFMINVCRPMLQNPNYYTEKCHLYINIWFSSSNVYFIDPFPKWSIFTDLNAVPVLGKNKMFRCVKKSIYRNIRE